MSFIMPSRRSTTNLIQASGELWDEEEPDAPLQFVVLAGGPATESRLAAIIRVLILLAPDDVTLEPVSIDGLPPFDALADGRIGVTEPVAAFRSAIRAADGFVLIVPADDEPALGSLLNALEWAATPTGEDALAGLPVVALAVGGDANAVATTQRRIRTTVESAGGIFPAGVDDLAASLGGPWHDRLGADGQLEDIATRQAIGQVLIRLREVASAGGEPDQGSGTGPGGADLPVA